MHHKGQQLQPIGSTILVMSWELKRQVRSGWSQGWEKQGCYLLLSKKSGKSITKTRRTVQVYDHTTATEHQIGCL